MRDLPGIQAILDSFADPAILLGNDYRILLANAAYQELYGDKRTLHQRHCYEVSHQYHEPCDLAGEHCPLRECRETGQRSSVLHVHHTPGGLEYVNVETTPIRDDAGQIQCFIEIMRPSDIAHTRARPEGLVGTSPAFRRMLDAVNRVAPSSTSVLLLGETGTGKEEVAQTIHARSNTRTGAFVPVECTGLAESLFESELFGHVKGAFTGATMDKTGLVEAAQGGTLFLDEIGDVTLAEQVKLLRLLETRRFRRVGSTRPRVADFRLICATNKDLAELVKAGEFREDLYFRLNVFEIELPALRDRTEDLPLLIDSLLTRLGASPGVTISPEALAALSAYPFPGNVRELRNVLERAVLMCDGATILPQHLPPRMLTPVAAVDRTQDAAEEKPATSPRPVAKSSSTYPSGFASGSVALPAVPFVGGSAAPGSVPSGTRNGTPMTLAEVERTHLRQVLARHRGSRKALARQLGLSERALYRKIAQLREADAARASARAD